MKNCFTTKLKYISNIYIPILLIEVLGTAREERKGEKIMFCPIIKEECKKTECMCFKKKRTRNVQTAGNNQPVIGECSLINAINEVENITNAINKLETTIRNTESC